jgi:hypothetical protein
MILKVCPRHYITSTLNISKAYTFSGVFEIWLCVSIGVTPVNLLSFYAVKCRPTFSVSLFAKISKYVYICILLVS